ncbi:MAG: presqualene diphosphate synthase HpnD [Gemmataceae bacterium]
MPPLDAVTLGDSYRACEAIARREAANFYPAFRLLPRPQRRAMCALYAFCRIADDIGDEPGPAETKPDALDRWRRDLDACLAGRFAHRIHPALADAVARYRIPPRYLHDVLDGVAMDLAPLTFPDFAALRLYCYRVASAVGLACIHIWGFSDDRARPYAENAGLAFQLTNILRDLKEDADRGRIYLPREDLTRFGYRENDLRHACRNEPFRRLMAFQIERARGFYEASRPLAPLLPPPGRAVFLMMSGAYRALLDEIERRDYDVFTARIRVSRWRKALLALAALPARFGWR